MEVFTFQRSGLRWRTLWQRCCAGCCAGCCGRSPVQGAEATVAAARLWRTQAKVLCRALPTCRLLSPSAVARSGMVLCRRLFGEVWQRCCARCCSGGKVAVQVGQSRWAGCCAGSCGCCEAASHNAVGKSGKKGCACRSLGKTVCRALCHNRLLSRLLSKVRWRGVARALRTVRCRARLCLQAAVCPAKVLCKGAVQGCCAMVLCKVLCKFLWVLRSYCSQRGG